MKLLKIKPSKSLNKAYYKQSLSREQIELFKKELQNTFNHIDEKQDEEYHKNVIADLFKNVYCKDKYLVNVNKKEDLVIRLGNTTTDDVGVLLEFKKPTEKRDMVSAENANVKALQEAVLYYLRQTVDNQNHKITNIVITNIYEWFIFDGVWFEKNVFRNAKLKKDYVAFKTSGHDTKYFYDNVAAKYLAEFTEEVPCTYFNLLDYKDKITNDNTNDDNDLIDLYKILSPEHLLNKKFVNDSNSLNTDFYNELLYIIGLEESKETAKKTIRRINEAERNEGSLIENTITKLKSKKHFGYDSNEETENQYYELGLELCITWLNRILFLKLLESQLIKYHRGDKENYAFLTAEKITDFDELEELFFEVLAEKTADRNPSIAAKYKDIPYLNSSLFEMTDLEKNALSLSNLKDRLEFPVFKKSVLKKGTKEVIKPKTSLKYLLEFLDAYNFASESNAKIQEENKSIINASVLGLIFEKINGYKDGSFFTPGFITMYMCRETIRKAVVEKFKTSFPKCESITDFEELKDKIDHTNKAQRQEANKLINDIKIVDPAVGSGHFLVSALNEMIAIKSDLQILSYANGNRVLGYTITLDNDELIIQNQETDKLFEYTLNQNNNIIPDLQELQSCLFHEKQTIIENCLFGVDINPKSVMICQLRLWIELLKNAYYINSNELLSSTDKSRLVPSIPTELQTLPNIDINIKTGNSLISKFAIKDNVFERITGFQKKLEEYKNWVHIYKNTNDKKAKAVLKDNVNRFKDEFKLADLRVTKLQNDLRKLNGTYYDKYQTYQVFASELTDKELKAKEKLKKEINDKQVEIQQLKDNPIYANAFEWRFEFPEVLDDKGNFIGFDVVIGNPPYITIGAKDTSINNKSEIDLLLNKFISNQYKPNLYAFFYEEGLKLLSKNGLISFIVPRTLLDNLYQSNLRMHLTNNFTFLKILKMNFEVFQDATTGGTNILIVRNDKPENNVEIESYIIDDELQFKNPEKNLIRQSNLLIGENKVFSFLNKDKLNLISKIEKHKKISNYFSVNNGVNTGNCAEILLSHEKINEKHLKILEGKNINKYITQWNGLYINYDSDLRNTIDLSKLKTKQSKIDFALRDYRIFSSPKIIIRQTGDKIIATLDEDKFVTRHSTHCLVNDFEKINLKFVLGILNSKLIDFYYNYLIPEKGKAFAEVKGMNIKQLPIFSKKNIQLEEKLTILVDQILSLKKINPQADTSNLENDIDELVYKLYELTPEEIEVVKKA